MEKEKKKKIKARVASLLPLVVVFALSGINGFLILKALKNLDVGIPEYQVERKERGETPIALNAIRNYRKEIVLENKDEEHALKNYQVKIGLDTLDLIREGKLSLDCSNLRFEDAETGEEISYWIRPETCILRSRSFYAKDETHRESEIWLRIVNMAPGETKKIYAYYGNKKKEPTSSFEKVFKEGSLEAFYLISELKEKTLVDFSANNNETELSREDFYWKYALDKDFGEAVEEHRLIFFNNWGWGRMTGPVYFETPSLNFDKSEGSISLWLKPYEASSGTYQRLVIDDNWEMELGINPEGGLYFYPDKAGSENYSLVKNAFTSNVWTHLVVTWDLQGKEVEFFINGERKGKSIDKTPGSWREPAETGAWQFGGTSLDIPNDYVGFMNNIKVYSRALEEDEIGSLYAEGSYVKKKIEVSHGEEEILFEEGDALWLDDFLAKSSSSKKFYIAKNYASPKVLPPYYAAKYPSSKGAYTDPEENISCFILPKGDKGGKPVFGEPDHFYAYEGTKVEIKEPSRIFYVGLNIGTPHLIDNLEIRFSRFQYEEPGLPGLLWIIPRAFACGPWSYYVDIGSSDLSFVSQKGDISWYRLEKPILVNEETVMAQILFTPNGAKGRVEIELEDMIFADEKGGVYRPVFESKGNERYCAYLVDEERGSMNLEFSDKLNLVFTNEGKKALTIDDDSLSYIKNEIAPKSIKTLRIEERVSNNLVSSLSMDYLEKELKGRTVESGKSIKVPFPGTESMEKDKDYSFVATLEEEKDKEPTQEKVLNWAFGKNYYYYPRRLSDDKTRLYIYNLKIRDNGVSIYELR